MEIGRINCKRGGGVLEMLSKTEYAKSTSKLYGKQEMFCGFGKFISFGAKMKIVKNYEGNRKRKYDKVLVITYDK